MRALLRSAYDLAGRLATALSAVAPTSGHKVARSFRARHGVLERFERWGAEHRAPNRPVVWLHAPSVGEGLQARPLIERLRARRPDVQLVYTFFSPSAEEFARSLPVDVADYLPFDSTPNAKRVLAAVRPTALVFSKLDVWPILCAEAHSAGVRLGLVSATLSERAGRRQPMARALLGDAYGALHAVGAIGTEDAKRLVDLGVAPDRVVVTGDTRYDQVWQRARALEGALRDETSLEPPVVIALRQLRSTRPTLVAGSTWPPDEHVLLPAWDEVRETVPGARLIIAPHEPTAAHLTPIERWAHARALSVVRLGEAGAADADVVLVNAVGVLAELYSLGTAAYVGGGFHRAGLHSVLEPAALGVPVLLGPMHGNSRDAALLLDAEGASVVRDHQDAADCISHWLGSPTSAQVAGRAARDLVQNGLGAADRAYELVESLLER